MYLELRQASEQEHLAPLIQYQEPPKCIPRYPKTVPDSPKAGKGTLKQGERDPKALQRKPKGPQGAQTI